MDITKSPWVFLVNCGSCNACVIEVVACLTPRYDVERVGGKLVHSPKHADVLLVTGAPTLKMNDKLKRVYDQMPAPKKVVAIGSCAISHGIFTGSYNMAEPTDKLIPTDAYIPGCPPRPEAIVRGLLALIAPQALAPTAAAPETKKESDTSEEMVGPDDSAEEDEREEKEAEKK